MKVEFCPLQSSESCETILKDFTGRDTDASYILQAEAAGVFMIQLINTLVTISPAGFEILTAGKQKPALWILQVSDYLRAAASLLPYVSSSNMVDSGEPDYVFTRLSIPDFIYLRIFVRHNQGTINLTAKSILV